jgi:hypothetical protein
MAATYGKEKLFAFNVRVFFHKTYIYPDSSEIRIWRLPTGLEAILLPA